MLKRARQSLLFAFILLVGVMSLSSCSNRYPIDVCRCSEIDISNIYDIFLVDKDTNVVTLSPSVAVVKKISPTAVILSNLKSQELIDNPKGPGHRYWEPFGTPNTQIEGYFLHRCDQKPLLVPLGMDREKAIALALKLVEEGAEESSATEQATEEKRSGD